MAGGIVPTYRDLSSFDIEVVPSSKWGKDGNLLQCYINFTDPKGQEHKEILLSLDTNGSGSVPTLPYRTDVNGKHFITVDDDTIADYEDSDTNNFNYPAVPVPGHPGETEGKPLPISVNGEPITYKGDTHGQVPETTQAATNYIISDNNVDTHLSMKLNTQGIKIPAKKYEPQELCSFISSQYELLLPTTNANPTVLSENQLLQTTKQMNLINNNTDTVYMNLEGSQQFIFNTTDAGGNPLNYLLGTSQFGLTYDQDSGKTELSAIHIPRYDNDGNNVVTCYLNDANQKRVLNKHSGIFITSVSKGRDLIIENKVNPSQNCLKLPNSLETSTNSFTANIDGTTFNTTMPTFLTDGVNITGDLSTLDTLVFKRKTTTPKRHFDMAPEFGQVDGANDNSFNDIVAQTDSIIANEPIDPAHQGNLGEGYYLIEVDFGINNDFTSTNIMNSKISNIVSRYYVNSNVISGSSDGSIFYEHKGAPLNLSGNFKCRILNPDGTLATDVNNKSSIFLEIVKPK